MDDDRIHELEASVSRLTALVDELRSSRAADDVAPPTAPAVGPSSRRHLFKLAGAATAGAVAATVAGTAQPASANDPNDLTLGTTTSTTGLTQARSSSTASGNSAFVFQVGGSYTNSNFFPAGLAGLAGPNSVAPNGIYGYTDKADGAGLVGYGSAGLGVRAYGPKAAMLLMPTGTAGPQRTDHHDVGELIEDDGGNLWLCTASGTPGRWRKLGGPGTAGSYHAISPVRVYDSRVAAPLPGPLAPGANRTVSVKDARNLTTGAVITANVVPSGAVAVFANVTVTNTQTFGFLAINPGGDTTVAASAINWTSTGQTVANGLVLTLNANRQITVIDGAGGGSADFIVDVSGYYL